MATDETQSELPPRTPSQRDQRPKRWIWGVALAGILLPVVAATVELTMRLCSSTFFDPCPTKWHFVLWAIIPLASALTIWAYLRNEPKWVTPITVMVGASLGIAVVYSLLFLPLLPFSLIGLLMLGIGACGFSPFLAVMASVSCSHRLRDMRVNSQERHARLVRWAAVIAVVPLVAFLAASLVTSYGVKLAASDDEATSRQGVQLLRAVGSESMLLRTCYELPTAIMSFEFWSSGRSSSPERREVARDVYFRVTGSSFNSVDPPRLFGPKSEWSSDFAFDSDVGGTAVSGRVTDLTMSSSRIDANIEPDALTAYTEWILTFKNMSTDQREARAEIALPSGGVVSRLTLWVNDEEREAAFAGRGAVRQAYQEVAVVQRRDPVLVTTCGPDRVLVQCFPVPPNGTMKVRIGITSPLLLKGNGYAVYTLPRFIERNFGTGAGVKHSLFVVSPHDLSYLKTRSHRIVTAVTDDVLTHVGSVVCQLSLGRQVAWCPDPADPRYAIVQTVSEGEPQMPKNIVLVIDGSRRLRESRSEISAVLGQLPTDCHYSVILAADEPTELTSLRQVESSAIKNSQTSVMRSKFVGGIDNRPALLKACDTAMSNENTAIVWLHGPQPLKSASYTEQILQRCERLPGSIRVYALPVADGRNSILADLERVGVVSAVPRMGTLSEDLNGLFDGWQGSSATVRRERVLISAVMPGLRASKHLARLWAYGKVLGICRTADSRKLDAAAQLAAAYQLVTPVSGAVVLETEEQYREAGLKPVDPRSVPSIVPEPPMWIALGLMMVLMLTVIHRKRLAYQRV